MAIRVVLPDRQPGWVGGVRYLSTIRSGISELEDRGIVEVLKLPRLILRESDARRKRGILNLGVYGADTLRGMLALNIPQPLGRLSKKSLAWIADLQDIERPELFGDLELAKREKLRRENLSRNRAFFFSSNHSQNVFNSIGYTDPLIAGVLRFSVRFDETLEENDQYFPCGGCLENGFFYLPNQWWIHKNHKWALESFMEYQSSGGRAHLVLTGVESDYRWPDYSANSVFSDLKIKNAHRLGMVSRSVQRNLYLNAIATIQPSSYEGWSTTIEEALSLGSPVIASNISSNLEQLIDCADAQLISNNSHSDLVNAFHSPPRKILNTQKVRSRHSFRWNRFLEDLEAVVTNGDELTRP